MIHLSLRSIVNTTLAITLAYAPNLASARDTSPVGDLARQKVEQLPPAPPAAPPPPPPVGGSGLPFSSAPEPRRRPNKKLKLDDPSKPGVTKVELKTYEDANPSAIRKAVTNLKDAAVQANAKYQAMRNRNADRVQAGRQKVADQFYKPANDPKIPIPSSRALAIPLHTPSPYGPVAVRPPQPTPAQPTLGPDGQGFESIPRFARDGGKVFTTPGLNLLQRAFGPDQRIEMGKRLHDVVIGKRTLLDFKRVELAGGAAGTAQVMAEMPNQVLTFGLALGAAAAVNLWWYHAQNPLAWQHYMEEMTDPVGWLGIAGFSMAMAPVTNLLSTEGLQRAGFAGQAPVFVGAVALAALVQNGLATFARDQDVMSCLGFKPLIDGYNRALGEGGGRFNDAKDYAACDRAYAKVLSGELSIDIFIKSIPSMASVAISGTLIYTILYGVQKYMPVERLMTALGIAATGSPMGLALRGVYSLGMTMLFLTVNKPPTDYFTETLGNWSLATLGKEGPLYAKTISRAQSDLMATWERVRANGWRDPLDFSGKDVCKDERRIGSPYYDCAKPRELDFTGVLSTFADVQNKWREQQLQPVLKIWREWTDKASTYRNTYDLAKDFYRTAIQKLAFSRLHPEIPDSDPRTFSLKNLDVKTSSAWPNFLRSIVARLDYYPSEDGAVGHVSTPRAQERFLTLMACGPEATGKAATGALAYIRNFTSDYITGNYAPREVFTNKIGEKVQFYPPRLTKPLDGTSESACERQFAMSMQKSPLEFMWLRLDTAMPNTLDKVVIETNGKRYPSLVDYIKDNVREDVLTPEGIVNIDAWWDAYVANKDQTITAELRNEYTTYMNVALPKALTNKDYYWCETSSMNQTPLGRYIGRISGMGGDCGPDRTQRLAYGAVNALRDQTVLYMAMMVDLYVANWRTLMKQDGKRGAVYAENKVIVPAQEAIAAYDAFTAGILTLTDAAQIEALETTMNQKVAAFMAIVLPAGTSNLTQDGEALKTAVPATLVKIKTTGKTETIPARPNYQATWMAQLGVGVISSLAEWQGYAKVASMQK